MRPFSLFLLSSSLFVGCASVNPGITDPGVICTAVAVSSLNVTVRDATTGQPVCDATVIALQGSDNYELRRTGDCRYAGPEERPGVFEVRAARAGYQAASMGNVRVNRDECHVIPVAVTVELRPGS
jgi:hypothetical protein